MRNKHNPNLIHSHDYANSLNFSDQEPVPFMKEGILIQFHSFRRLTKIEEISKG